MRAIPKPTHTPGLSPARPREADPRRHADLLTAAEACEYLRLDEACESMEAARERLNRFCRDKALRPIEWGKTRIYSRRDLDAFVEGALNGSVPGGLTSDHRTEGNSRPETREGSSEADGHQDAHQTDTLDLD